MKSNSFSRANELFREGRYDDAIPIYRECIEHDPKFHPYHDNLAAALEKLGRLEEADQTRKSAAELRPGSRVTGNTSEAVSARTAEPAAEPVHTRVMREEGWEEDPAVNPMLNARRENDDALKRQYDASPLAAEPDTFVLYRIIGNDLYPRHAKGQSRENVRFILEYEPELEGCEKRWLLNRIFDTEERQAIIELLEHHRQSYLEIPFESEAFAQIGWDYSALPEPGYLSSAAFYALAPEENERVITAVYRKKNLYLMNNNGARNAALEDGRGRGKWVLPWDGNCFVTRSGWQEIRAAVRTEPRVPYYVVSMQRITDNAELLQKDFAPNPVEEPQLLFRRDARERFGENHPYGRRPKVELFWRLAIPGKWDSWKDDPWEQPRSEPSPDFGAWGVAGWVARLASGKADLEASTTESFKNRGRDRQKAIRTTINHVTRQVSAQPDPIGLTCYRFEPIEALRQECQHQGEGGPPSELLQTLLANAAKAMERPPESPADKPEPGPSGDVRDYYHLAPYWWPNPDTKDGLPYVRRDGERVPGTRMYEPESYKYDRTRLQRLFDDSTTLALAAFVTGDHRYANHAVRWLERWFIDPATRMNPHLTYAQVRRGKNKNRGAQTGVIEMKDFYYYLDAVRLLRHLGALSTDREQGLQEWLREYLEWLLTSEQGTKEAQARNNHGTYYDLQVAAIAAFLEDHDTLYATLARAEERIPLQIDRDGIQTEEMKRTNTAHYCCFTLQGWLNLLNLALRYDGAFVKRAGEADHPLRKAVEWLLAHDGSSWPYQQIGAFDPRRLCPLEFVSTCLGLKFSECNKREVNAGARFSPHDGIQPYWFLVAKSASLNSEDASKNDSAPKEVRENQYTATPENRRSARSDCDRRTIAFPHRGAKSVLKPSGATISMMLLASELRKIGFNAIIMLHKDGMSSAQATGAFRESTGPWKDFCDSYGVPCYTVDSPYMGKGMPKSEDQKNKVTEYREQWQHALSHLGVDAIHTNDASMHATWGVLLKGGTIPHVWHERGLFKHEKSEESLSNAAAVIAISEYVKSLAAPKIRSRCWVVENPVQAPDDLDRSACRAALVKEFGFEEKALIFGAVANDNPRKRWDRFVDIAERIRGQDDGTSESRPTYFLAIGGGCAQVARILGCTNEPGQKAGNVILAGYRSPVFPTLAGLDCVLALADDEPLGRVLVEAGQLGVPVFANKSGGHIHILQSRAPEWLFQLDSGLEEIVSACTQLRNDPARFRSRAASMKHDLRAQFSPEAHVRRVRDVYSHELPGRAHETRAAVPGGHRGPGGTERSRVIQRGADISELMIERIRNRCHGFQSLEVYKRYAEYASTIKDGDIVDIGVARGGSTASYAYGLSLHRCEVKSVVYAIDRYYQMRSSTSHTFHNNDDVQSVVRKNQEALLENMCCFGVRKYVRTIACGLNGNEDPLPSGIDISLLSLDAGPSIDDHLRLFYDRLMDRGWIVVGHCRECVNRQGRENLEKAIASADPEAFLDELEAKQGIGTGLGKNFLIARLSELFVQRGLINEEERIGSTVFFRKSSAKAFSELVSDSDIAQRRQQVRDEFLERLEGARSGCGKDAESERQFSGGGGEASRDNEPSSRSPRSDQDEGGTEAAATDMVGIRSRSGSQMFVNPRDPRLKLIEKRAGHGQTQVYKVWDWAAQSGLSNLFLDIGANYGEIALGSSYPEGATVALVEANPELEKYLTASVAAHSCKDRLKLVIRAVGEHAGTVRFAVSERSSGKSSSVFDSGMLRKGAYREIEVPMCRLDDIPVSDMKNAHNAIMKVDVEGAELSVLRGGREWLSGLESYLAILEFNPEAMMRACGSLCEFIQEADEYGQLYELAGGRIVPFDADKFCAEGKNKDVIVVKGEAVRSRLLAATL